MYIVKYGVIFFTNRFREDVLVFKSLDELKSFKALIEKSLINEKHKFIIDDKILNLEKYRIIDIKRNRDVFDEQIIVQFILGNCVFDNIVMNGFNIIILDKITDPFIHLYR